MKASGEGQTLRVFCEKSEQTLTVAVEDQGIGMSPEELKKITEPFYMADKSRSRKEGGVGLGLSLCASIAERHHAQLTFESALGTVSYTHLREYRLSCHPSLRGGRGEKCTG